MTCKNNKCIGPNCEGCENSQETMKVKVQTTTQEPYEIELPLEPVDVPTMFYKSGFKACDEIFSKKIDKLKALIEETKIKAFSIKSSEIEFGLKTALLEKYLGLLKALEIIEEK